MKRKRGRPKGSTKKPSPEEELAERSALPGADGLRAPEEGGSLECSKCCRKFSNPRQLRKHICIIVLNLGEAEGDAGKSAPLQGAPTARTPFKLAVSFELFFSLKILKIILFTPLFMAMLRLHCCAGFYLAVESRGYSLVGVQGGFSLRWWASLVLEPCCGAL